MGTHIIKMPDIGEGIAEVELVEWFVKVGDSVGEDQIIADVMTDKATVEIPSAVAGIVLALGGVPGQVMAVGAELIRIEVTGTGNASGPAAGEAPEQHVDQLNLAVAEPGLEALPDSSALPSTSAEAEADAGEAAKIEAGHQTETRSEAQAAPGSEPAPTTDRPLAAPAVRHRAREEGIALRQVTGSGPEGRITQADLDVFIQQRQGSGHAASETGDQRVGTVQIPVLGMRRKIAQRMQEASRNVAHFSYVEEIDITALESLRSHLNQTWAARRGHLTLLPLIARALVVALRDFPQMNAHYDDQAQVITQHSAVHLGIATQGDHGLLVPVLRHAEGRDLWSNAAQIARIAQAAREGSATREVLSGSTITLSSLGALGGIVSTPLINLPEVAIVGVNRKVERAVVVNGQIAVRSMMNLSSSFDHRVVDGMDAARFIQAVRHLLEHPATLFID
jgi:2-oxoisovalerate dehydrogenase E2 component (dihydrolipoyl transacylase)